MQLQKITLANLRGFMCFIIRNPAHPIERQLHFPGEGKITADDVAINNCINSVINLKLSRLMSNRRAVLAAFQKRLQRGRRLDPARELLKWDGSQPGELEPFAGVVVYWLQKRQARIAG
jgi:hypothetical protein